MSTGVIVKGARSSNGTVTISLERGSLNHHRVISKDEIRKAYKVALKGNA